MTRSTQLSDDGLDREALGATEARIEPAAPVLPVQSERTDQQPAHQIEKAGKKPAFSI
jgi:hypothetical protein